MDTLFKTHKDISEEEFTSLWQKGIFIFDSNVLLDLYRLPETARNDLLSILSDKILTKRIWLPFQVFLEFTYNKIDAIGDQKNKYIVVRETIRDSLSQIELLFSDLQKKLADLQLKKRHSTINPDPFVNDKLFKSPIDILNKFLQELNDLEKKQPDVNDKDLIKEKIYQVFNGKIGQPYSKLELEAIYKDGESRYKENIPPGYKDKAKEGQYFYEDKKFIRKYGDLIVWKEIVRKCITDKIEYIILVTGDSKEDWWQEKRGRKIGPRYELLNEIYFEAKSVKLFHMYDTSIFMQYSRKYLNINIKEQSIVETKDLLEFSKESASNFEKGVLSIRQILDLEVSAFPRLRMRYSNTIPPKKYLIIPPKDLHLILTEIFSNVKEHSDEQIVNVRTFRIANYLGISFMNKIRSNGNDKNEIGMGIKFVMDVMEQYGQAKIFTTSESFKIVLYFDIRYVLNNDIITGKMEF